MKKLVEKRPDMAFYLKLFALVSPDPRKVKSIACGKSLSVLEDAYEHKEVATRECASNEVEDNTKFAKESGITAAPALIFPDGSLQLGFSEAAELEKKIDGTATPKKE
jgi:thiol:disulfide interchange protein DsbC